MPKKMLINMAQPGECRIAVIEGSELVEIDVERRSSVSQWGNIYRGKVVNVEPSIQAAFVEIGEKDRGFLHITDVCPAAMGSPAVNGEGRRNNRRIQDYLSKGQEVVAQITRNGIGDKGPTLTTYLSIPGRYLVLMPHIKKSGVSRKIEDPDRRKTLRRLISEIRPAKEMGFIVRTAGADLEAEDLQRDMEYLLSLWALIEKRGREASGVATLFEEGDLVIRTIRDLWSDDFEEIVIDSEAGLEKVQRYMDLISAGAAGRVHLHDSTEPLFDRYRVEERIEDLYRKRVPLPSGGSLIIEPTEALVAIDVNSGRYTEQDDIEETALWTNLEAVKEVCRQLRLRDLGGVIVIDFIDMREEANRRKVEEAFRAEMRKDRARTRATRISEFGILELTRQRVGPSIKSTTHQPCPSCAGKGMVKSAETIGLEVIRAVQRGLARNRKIQRIEVRLNPLVEGEVQNRERQALARLESDHAVKVQIVGRADVPVGEIDVSYFSDAGSPVRIQ